jgi:hypothetical protein
MATTRMRHVTSDDLKAWGDATLRLQALFDDLPDAVEKVNDLIGDINGAIEDATGIVQEIADEAQSDFEERSERWQQGDAGSEYQGWVEQLTELIGNMEQLDAFEAPEPPEWVNEDLPEQA